MVGNQTQGEEKQRQVAFEGRLNGSDQHFNFDMWATAVRQQMLAALKKRESSRANWS
jgi:hypothetical protein